MLKQMAKKLIRKAVHRVREIADEPTPNGPHDAWAGAYTLNPLYVEVANTRDHQYTWGVVQGIHLAKTLGIQRASVIEFGVAGGHGLLALEKITEKLQALLGVEIEIFGFDTGAGLTKPVDHRDMPNLWMEGDFAMNVEKLKRRLKRAQLVLGPVVETIESFIRRDDVPPVAFAAFDVDLYSSTTHAFRVFEADRRLLLPRVHCLFDDILGYTFGDHVGERLAIADFNSRHEPMKISPIYGIQHYVPKQFADRMWEKNYMTHIFDHPLYSAPDGAIPPYISNLLQIE